MQAFPIRYYFRTFAYLAWFFADRNQLVGRETCLGPDDTESWKQRRSLAQVKYAGLSTERVSRCTAHEGAGIAAFPDEQRVGGFLRFPFYSFPLSHLLARMIQSSDAMPIGLSAYCPSPRTPDRTFISNCMISPFSDSSAPIVEKPRVAFDPNPASASASAKPDAPILRVVRIASC